MAVSRIQDEFLQCTICYEIFLNPKTLPCLHTFCEHCLTAYIKKAHVQPPVTEHMGFLCPLCRDFVKAPDPTKSPSAWAAMFKTNFHMNKLKKALEEEQVRAVPDGLACSEHPQQQMDLCCVPCRKAICHLCAGISHRGCNLVVTLTEASEDRRVMLQVVCKEMNATLIQSREEVTDVKKCLEGLNTMKGGCKQDVKTVTRALIDVIKKREEELLKEIDEKYGRLCGRVHLKIDKFREEQTTYHQTLVQATELASGRNPYEVLKHYDKFRNSSVLDMTPLSALKEQLKRADMKFIPGVSVAELTYNVNNMGSIVLEEAKPEVTISKAVSSPPCSQVAQRRNIKPRSATFSYVEEKQVVEDILKNTSTPPPTRRRRCRSSSTSETFPTATLVKTVSGRHRDDAQPPKLIDIIIIPQSKETPEVLLVTDWNNQCVKAYNSMRDRDGRLPLDGKPWSITALSRTKVAVSLPLSQQICVLQIGSSMMLLSSVLAEKRYSGLAALDMHTLAASGGSSPPSVDIITISGEVLRSFSRDSSNTPLFAYPGYLCVTPTGQILVSDRDGGTLTCLTRDGTVVWCFRPSGAQELVNPAGVFCDFQGKVLFVENRGVLSLSAEGHYLGVVLRARGAVQAPRGVWVGKSGQVYLTSNEEDISVFRLNTEQ